jgi:copper chaperone
MQKARYKQAKEATMVTLSVPDMSCGHCKASIEAALAPHARRVEVDLPARKVHAESETPIEKLLEALSDIGFPASVEG